MRWTSLALLVLAACQPSADELQRRADAEVAAAKERARVAVEQRKAHADELARGAAEQEKANTERANEKAERGKDTAAKLYRERLETYWAMDPTGREKAMREVWAGGGDEAHLAVIADAGASEVERKKLAALAQKLAKDAKSKLEAAEAKSMREARERFADTVDRLLLDRHMSPDRVTASGTVLHIDMVLCSRQLMHDLTSGRGDISPAARALGFTRIECASAFQSAWQDL